MWNDVASSSSYVVHTTCLLDRATQLQAHTPKKSQNQRCKVIQTDSAAARSWHTMTLSLVMLCQLLKSMSSEGIWSDLQSQVEFGLVFWHEMIYLDLQPSQLHCDKKKWVHDAGCHHLGKCSLSWLAATNSLQGDLTAEGQHTSQHDHHTTQAEPDRHGLLSLFTAYCKFSNLLERGECLRRRWVRCEIKFLWSSFAWPSPCSGCNPGVHGMLTAFIGFQPSCYKPFAKRYGRNIDPSANSWNWECLSGTFANQHANPALLSEMVTLYFLQRGLWTDCHYWMTNNLIDPYSACHLLEPRRRLSKSWNITWRIDTKGILQALSEVACHREAIGPLFARENASAHILEL